MKRKLCLIGAMIVIAGFGFSADAESGAPSAIQEQLIGLGFRVFTEPVEAPDFELENLAGEQVKLSDFRGKTVFLNFWATWCPPCRAEMPSMQSLYETIGNESFEIIAVDLQESRSAVASYVEEGGYTFPVLLDSNGRVGATYGARSIPTTFLIDPDGNAIGYLVGSRSWEGEVIEALFRELVE